MTGTVQGSAFCTGTEACWGVLVHLSPQLQPLCRLMCTPDAGLSQSALSRALQAALAQELWTQHAALALSVVCISPTHYTVHDRML